MLRMTFFSISYMCGEHLRETKSFAPAIAQDLDPVSEDKVAAKAVDVNSNCRDEDDDAGII